MKAHDARATRRALVALAVLLLAGCFGDSRPHLSIQWGVAEELEGAQVEIDGKVAGTLKKFGENPQTGFQVDKGEHTVRILHPRFDSETYKFDAQLRGMKHLVILNFAETSTSGKPMIVFQR